MKWNRRQEQAIEARRCNLLIAAAAGSGKTTVLVERIAALVREGLSIDRLLVVTFTRAAASEMREKILKNFQSIADGQDGHARLFAEQAALVEHAQISTLHNFCTALLRAHFQAAGVDPTFRVADEREVLPLREEALRAVVAAAYEEANEDFSELAARWTDEQIRQQVDALYRFLLAQPEPWLWLERSVAAYQADEAAIEHSAWVGALLEGARTRIASAEANFVQAERDCRLPGGIAEYLDALERDRGLCEALRERSQQGYDALRTALDALAFVTLARAPKGCDTARKERAQKLRNAGKDILQKMSKELFALPLSEHAEDLRRQAPQLRALAALVRALDEAYAQRKQARNLLDFSDLEHKALEAVRQPAVAEAVRTQYQAIFVDEYQDSSVIQEELIQRIAREDNVFLVGDVKQSIYRFRQADPSLFLKKADAFSTQEGARDLRIDLNENFRSRKNVLDAVNDVFAYAMRREVTEIPYDKEARLNYGQEGMPGTPDPAVELLLSDSEAAEEDQVADGEAAAEGEEASETSDEGAWLEQTLEVSDAISQQALLAARRIHALMQEQVWDAKRKESRAMRYRDIVILLRAAKDVARQVQRVLEQQGIPVYSNAGDAYFAMPEIRTVIDLLRVVDNPLHDTALMGALHGPAARLSNDALLDIRRAHLDPDISFYDAVQLRAQVEDGLGCKVRNFMEMISELRLFAQAKPLEALIWKVFELTGCYARAGALPGGRVRQANLRMLARRAATFEQHREGGLPAFLWEAEQLRARGDTESAKALGEGEDVVRIMTMHMSKGLEFPVVICLDLSRSFARKSGGAPPIDCHAEQGLALPMIDPVLRTRYNTLPLDAIHLKRKKEDLADATRLLYVAMTRAMDRLILIGMGKRGSQSLATRLERWAAVPPGALLAEAKSMLDLLLPPLLRHPDGALLRRLAGEQAELPEPDPTDSRWLVEVNGTLAMREQESVGAEAWLARLQEGIIDTSGAAARLAWTPPALPDDSDRLKTTVSALLRQEQGEAAYFPPRAWPLFLEQRQRPELGLRGLDGAARGTAFHAAMRGLTLERLRNLTGKALLNEITAQLDALAQADRLRPAERLAVRVEAIAAFLSGEIGQLMMASERVRREWAFNLRSGTGQEVRLVQGVLDCCFLDAEQGWVLVDFKTDGDADTAAVMARYAPQIALYAQALARITVYPVHRAGLYLTKNGIFCEYSAWEIGKAAPGGEWDQIKQR